MPQYILAGNIFFYIQLWFLVAMDFKLVSPEAPLLDTRKEKNIQHLTPQKTPTLLFHQNCFYRKPN